MRASRIPVTVGATLLLVGAPVFAQQTAPPPAEDVTAPAKKTQNPVRRRSSDREVLVERRHPHVWIEASIQTWR